MADIEALKAAHTAAYLAAQDADGIFSAELVRQFGKAAGDRRYDAARTGWDEATKAAGYAYVEAAQARHAAWLALGEAEKGAAHTPRYTVREDGEANHWSIMWGEPDSPPSRWLMVAKLNGELMDAKQRAIMQRIADLLNTHGEG